MNISKFSKSDWALFDEMGGFAAIREVQVANVQPGEILVSEQEERCVAQVVEVKTFSSAIWLTTQKCYVQDNTGVLMPGETHVFGLNDSAIVLRHEGVPFPAGPEYSDTDTIVNDFYVRKSKY